MSTVNSTNGKLQIADLGRTLIHEHVTVGFPGWWLDARQPAFKIKEVLPRVVDAFQQLHDFGVRTVIDPCPMDLGRNVELCAEVAQRAKINILCTTGMYNEEMGISYTFKHMSADEIAEVYIKEIEDGIGETGIKAGLIKVATGDGKVTDFERKALTAAARAAKATGVPLISHTENCSCGHDQIDIVTGEGLPAHQLIVGHSDGRDDHEYQKSLAERGAYVGFDRFGIEFLVPDSVRMKNLKALVDAGFRDRVMVSHDTVNCIEGGWLPGAGTMEDIAKIAPNWRLTHLFENIFPQLKDMGMSEADIEHIVVENPRRYFTEARKQ